MTDRVFEDRVGLLVVDAGRGVSRRSSFKAFRGGLIRDVFMPRTSSADDLAAIRAVGLYAHIWCAVDGLAVDAFVARTLDDLARSKAGAVELNIELGSDAPLPAYVEAAIRGLRARLPRFRIRVNLGGWKGFAVPVELVEADPNLYVCEQAYLGNMDELLSPADVLADLVANGCPPAKATVCYAASCTVLGSASRLRTLPDLSRRHRGVIYQDDLMTDAGLL